MSFDHLHTIYRSFDIRGKFPEEITAEEVRKIGQVLVNHYQLKKVAIGRDNRPSTDVLFAALCEGLTSQGANVIDLGLTTTPMTYFMAEDETIEATVMITASHMPSEYNGLKITLGDATPLSAAMIQEVKEIVGTHTYEAVEEIGEIESHALQPDWIKKFKQAHDLSGANLKVVLDPANMVGILEIPTFEAFAPDITVSTIYDTLDHTCPNHEANPVKHETLVDLGKTVVSQEADIGIAFDGDADRVGFVDEKGQSVPADLIGMLLAKQVLKTDPAATVVYDIRSTKALPELVEASGGVAIMNRVGHSFIKATMREHGATLGIELSGHYFFKSAQYSEGGPLPAFLILELMKETKQPLSELIAEVKIYHHSGEINSEISQPPEAIYEALRTAFPDAIFTTIDGLTITYPDWWCNVRPSANDPVMRMNLEANTAELRQEKQQTVLDIIRS